MVDTQPTINYEKLSQPGLKDLLGNKSTEYRAQARLFGGVAVASLATEVFITVAAFKSADLSSYYAQSAYLIAQTLAASNTWLNTNRLARKFAGAIESLDESKLNYNTVPYDFEGLQSTLEAVANMSDKELKGSHRLLEVAKYQAQRMTFINKYEKTGDLGMLEAQRDILQQTYLEATLKKEEFVMPEIKTATEDSGEFAAVKAAWVNTKLTECDWAIAVAQDDKVNQKRNDLIFYSTNMRIDQGLNGKLVGQAATIINSQQK